MTTILQLLLDASIRVTAVALAVWLTLVVFRIRSGSVRHLAWLGVLLAMFLMPVLLHIVPRISIPIPRAAKNAETIPFDTASLPTEPSPVLPTTVITVPESSTIPLPEPVKYWTIGWPDIILFVYGSVLLVLLCRCLSGWVNLHRILRTSRQILIGSTAAYESDLISAPVTVGLQTRKILLPVEWSEWPSDKLRAVLAHESAHVERRDTITGLLAHLNRCFFWFHPLAWWLERQLALAAEQACDDAGALALGENRKYAQVLLDMAEVVRQRGSLLSYVGTGVNGTGLLRPRIDRLLCEKPFSKISGIRKVLVGLSCATSIYLAAACQQKRPYTGELRPDPAIAQTLAKREALQAIFNMSAQQAEALEAAVKKAPENIQAREQLMTFYQSSGRKVFGDKIATERFWAHKLWLIEHHPENLAVRLLQPLWDQAGYEKAKKLWLAYLGKKDVPGAVLSNAAAFFQDIDPQLAENILLRAQTASQKEHWQARLGSLYASIIIKAGPQPYVQDVRKKLDESQDPELLSAAGYSLAVRVRLHPSNQEFTELGKSYLERTLKLDPNSQTAKGGLDFIQQYQKSQDRIRAREQVPQAVRSKSSDAQYMAVSALPESERFGYLSDLANRAYAESDMLEYYQHDLVGSKKQWELARKYAEDALRLAPRFTGNSNYGNAVYVGNMVLGMLAMRKDGDLKAATKYLLAASKTPGADDTVQYLTTKLPTLLLKYGGPDQRKAVIEYLERCGHKIDSPLFDLLHSAQQLREGDMPVWYQSAIAAMK